MGAKKLLTPFALFASAGGSMTGTSVIHSSVTDVRNLDNIGLQVNWTGTPTGTLIVEGSNDGTTFYALTFSPSLAQPSGSASGYLISLNQFPWIYCRVSYTNSSGSGNLFVTLAAKDLN